MMSSVCLRRIVSRTFSLRSFSFSISSGSKPFALRPLFLGVSADRVPASRWRRQAVRFEEYSPSRRSRAPRLPGSVPRIGELQDATLVRPL